jgi:hypothetical protein
MPIQYGSYSLSNSKQVKPFAGSVLPELTSVANTLQERYDTALNQEDLLGRALGAAQAAPFTQDQKLLSDLKGEYRTRIKDRSKRGDYENMMRDTMLDAKSFVDRYQPIAENAKRLEEYKGSLQQAVAKGDIKSPDKARRLLALATQSYPGLSYDPVTGQYANHFQGMSPVKDIDPTEKVDKWMKDVAPTVLGTKTRYTDGVWMQEKEGKWTTLTPKEINQVITAGRRLDPEFNAWMDQEKQLAGVDYSGVTAESVKNMPDGPIKQAVMTSMAQGSSPARAIGQIAGASREQDVYHNMQQYANKYIRNDQETASGPTGADPYNLERHKKKLEDEQLVLSMPILQPEARAEVQGAEDMIGKIKESTTAVQASRQKFDDWVRTSQLRPRNGQWVDADGNDKTMKYLEQKQVYEQAQHGLQNLRGLEAEARRRTGYNPEKNITPALIKEAEKAGERALSGYAGEVLQPDEAKQIRQAAKSQYLRTNSAGYAQYDQVLKDMTAKGAQLINVQNFNTKSGNEQATNLFKNLALNLDAGGLNSGPVGLKWASGDAAGDDLSADDYKKVSADAVFAGYGMDTDGQLKFYYKVGDVKQNAKGKLVGEQALVKMPALPGTTEMLLKHKQTDLAQLGLGQSINQTINTPSGQGYMDIGGGHKIFVDRIDKSEIGNQETSGGINLRFPAPGGTYTEVKASSVGDAINIITRAMQANMQKAGTK